MRQVQGAARLRRWTVPFIIIMVSVPIFGQSDTEDRLADLESKLKILQESADQILSEIEAIRSELGIETTEEDLLDVEPIPAVSAEPTDDLLAQPISSAPLGSSAAGSSGTIFNPRISMIGNIVGTAGDAGGEGRESFSLEEAEMSLDAFVDPYARARFYIGFGEHGAELEEGYIDFINLPGDLTMKAGKLRASFGKVNPLHFHAWPTPDKPLVHERFFGDEGVLDSGISISHIIPRESSLVEVIGEVYRGEVEELFEPEDRADLMFLGRLRYYTDLSDSSNVEIGGSWLRGHLPAGGSGQFYGTDFTYRWKPLSRAIYRSLLGRAELIWNDRDDQSEIAFGYFAEADYQFARRWLAGVRIDRSDRPDDPSLTDEGGALVLTFRPSEFSLIRGMYRQVEFAEGFDTNELLFQIQFGIGAHGAHPF